MAAFLRQLVSVFVLILGLTAAAAYVVDPYAYWGQPTIKGFNHWKPHAGRHVWDTKKRQYAWVTPATVLAGNSRVEAGFDPESAAWPRDYQPVYNFGIRGASMERVVDDLLEAIEDAPPKRIYLGVDFMDFLVMPQTWRTAGHPAPAPGSGLVRQADMAAEMLLSLDALRDTVGTVLAQDDVGARHLTPRGFNPLGQFVLLVRDEGHRSLFDTTLHQIGARYAKKSKRVAWPFPGANPAWLAVERLARRARERNIELVLFTYPYRVEMLQLFGRLGLEPARAQWRNDLAAFGRKRSLAVWDFTQVNAVTAEPVPPAGDHRPMRYWWEIGHFKPPVADMMIRRMTLGGGTFGQPLMQPSAERVAARSTQSPGLATFGPDRSRVGGAPLTSHGSPAAAFSEQRVRRVGQVP